MAVSPWALGVLGVCALDRMHQGLVAFWVSVDRLWQCMYMLRHATASPWTNICSTLKTRNGICVYLVVLTSKLMGFLYFQSDYCMQIPWGTYSVGGSSNSLFKDKRGKDYALCCSICAAQSSSEQGPEEEEQSKSLLHCLHYMHTSLAYSTQLLRPPLHTLTQAVNVSL